MKAIAVAIVGMGPRGLTVLERILEHAHSLPEASRLDIEVFEPGDCGQGVHPAGQSDHLLINTVASQVTMFAPGSVAGGEEGLSLVQWAHLSGYRRHGDRYLRTFEDSGRAITDADHLPRSCWANTCPGSIGAWSACCRRMSACTTTRPASWTSPGTTVASSWRWKTVPGGQPTMSF